jgi:hypothetical protein
MTPVFGEHLALFHKVLRVVEGELVEGDIIGHAASESSSVDDPGKNPEERAVIGRSGSIGWQDGGVEAYFALALPT